MIEKWRQGKISIVIPIYNVSPYLERCLESVLSQTFKNLEVILVDDGSTDNCWDICNFYAERDRRVRKFHQKNQGVSAARNKGLDVATGDYIGFVDPDDYIHPEMYERLYTLLKINEADMSACFSRGCWDSGYQEPLRDDIKVKVYENVGAVNTVFDPEYGINGVGVVIYNRLYKKELFNNIRFSTKYKRAQDEHIICNLMKRVKKLVFTDERLYYYFNRSDSAIHKRSTAQDNIMHQMNLLDMYEERLLLFNEDKYKKIYDICYVNLMNLTISAFFNIQDRNVKETLRERYDKYYKGFSMQILSNLPPKDRVRFITFKSNPKMYKLILLLAEKRKAM
ncbi:glycosyltransferase [Robertmurraya sp. GLU-23]